MLKLENHHRLEVQCLDAADEVIGQVLFEALDAAKAKNEKTVEVRFLVK